MSDDASSRRWPWLRIFRIVLIAPFLLIVFGWLVLYGDSVYQRRKAEKLLKDLTSFPFATANFEQVREFVLAHGGAPSGTELVYRLTGHPTPPPAGYAPGGAPANYYDGAPCTPQGCGFEIEISNRWSWLLLYHQRMQFFWLDLDSLGVRPWKFRARFSIGGGRLNATGIGFVTLQSATGPSWRELYPVGYGLSIEADRYWRGGTAPYDVTIPVKPRGKNLEAVVRPTAAVQIRRALDIEVSCATRVFRGCRELDEVAPSAWADYQSLHARWQPGWDETEFGPPDNPVWLFVGGTAFVGTFAVIGALLERLRREKPANRRILQ